METEKKKRPFKEQIKEITKKAESFGEDHLVFILTLILTYVVGFLLALIAFFFKDNWRDLSAFEAWRSFLEAIIPTTITYVLVLVFENVINIIKEKKDHYVWNVITLVSVLLYLLIYTFYQLFWNTWFLVILEMVLTVLLLVASTFSYREIYISNNRKHNIVPNQYK